MSLVNADAKSYVLVSMLDPEVYSKYVEDKAAAHLSGFAFAVIGIIHLAGGKMPEGKERGSKHILWLGKHPPLMFPSSFGSHFRGPLASVEAGGFERD